MSTSLLINTFINDELKFYHFKITFSEIFSVFESIHIKVRGSFKKECINYATSKAKNNIFTYQNLGDKDWISSTLLMVKNINSKNIFIYNEDHKLNCELGSFEEIINDFNNKEIDYMSYSFFKASKLNAFNILPLKPNQNNLINYFDLDRNKLNLIGKISPGYYYVSLIALFSKKYLTHILINEDFRYKFYFRLFSSFIVKIFNYRRRYIFNFINLFFNKFKIKVCLYPKNTPFNFEKIWFENQSLKSKWRYGISNKEIFINYDDDNGMYCESLIKRGLYPFNNKYFLGKLKDRKDLLSEFILELDKDEKYDCTFFSTIARINLCPVLTIKILSGEIKLATINNEFILEDNNKIYVYSNMFPKITAVQDSKIKISIFDEVVKNKLKNNL